MDDKHLSFKEMCTKFDVTPRTLRYYEYIELIAPERRGRNRVYHGRDVARMTLILRGRRWGFSLEEIRQWLLIYEDQGTEVQMRELVRLADRQIATLGREREQLSRAIEELEAVRTETLRGLDNRRES